MKNPSFLTITAQKMPLLMITASKGDFADSCFKQRYRRSDSQWPPQENGASAVLRCLSLYLAGANVARLSKAQSVYRQLEQRTQQRNEIVYGLEKLERSC